MDGYIGDFPFEDYDMSIERGFLPAEDPLQTFSHDADPYLQALDALAQDLPELLETDGLRPALRSLDVGNVDYDAMDDRELFRTYQISSFLASGYVHQVDADPVARLPEGVAVPLYESAKRLNVPPILSYDAYSLHNFAREDDEQPVALGNIDTITNFVELEEGPANDESWFMLVHAEIEREAAPGITALPYAQKAVELDDPETVLAALQVIDESLDAVAHTMKRMPEHNFAENYGVYRPYIEGFEDIVYDGVDELDGPQSFRGETGAQSSIYPALDAFFGVPHEKNVLTEHIQDMRPYMPEGHREFIAFLEDGPDVSSYIADVEDDTLRERMIELHDSALSRMIAFRFVHYQYAQSYIEEPLGDDTGTGGTPFVPFLWQLIEETEEQLIGDPQDNVFGYLLHTFDDMPDFGGGA